MGRFAESSMMQQNYHKVPKISVLVPIYNVEKYLRRCINSVINQDFHEWELILVDDGSPDSSPRICDEYSTKDLRIKVVHKRNGGLPSARLEGFRNAQGKYLVFLDSDDYLLPHALSTLFTKIEEGYDLVRAGYRMIYSETQFKDIVPNVSGNIKGASAYRQGLLNGKIDPFMWGAIFRKEHFSEDTFIPVVPFSVGEDTITNYRVSRNINNIYILCDILYGYYMDWNSIMHQKIASHQYLDRMYLLMKSSLSVDECDDMFKLDCYITAQHINYSFYQEIGFDKCIYDKYVGFVKTNGVRVLSPFLGRNFFVIGIKIQFFHFILTRLYGYILLFHRWKGHKRKVIF